MATRKTRVKSRRRAASAKKSKKPKVGQKGTTRSSSVKTRKTKRTARRTKSKKKTSAQRRNKKTVKASAKRLAKRRAASAKCGMKRKKPQKDKRAPKRRKLQKKSKPKDKKRRKRRSTRTGVQTIKLRPKKVKQRVKTSGPVEINSYTYDVLYKQFLDEFLPRLCEENGVDIDKRSCRVMRNIFDPPTVDEEQYEVNPSATMLNRAKQAVLTEIARQEKQTKRGRRRTTAGSIRHRSGMERMFYVATGEEDLYIDYNMMRKMVNEAKLCKFRGDDRHDMGYMDPNTGRIKINKDHKMTMYEIKMTLMHEVMHNTIKRRGRPGNPEISEATEHLAMALCGDPDEFTVLLAEPKIEPRPEQDEDEDLDDVDSDSESYCSDGFQPYDGNNEDEDAYQEQYLAYLKHWGFEIDDIPTVCSTPDAHELLKSTAVQRELSIDRGSPVPKLTRSRTF